MRHRVLGLLLCALVGSPLALAQQDEEDPFARLYGEEDPDVSPEQLPDDPLERAVVLLNMGRHDEAEVLLKAAREEDPDDKAAAFALARLHLKCGRSAEVDALISELIESAGNQPHAYLLRGIRLEQQGKLSEAEESLRSAYALSRRFGGALMLESLVRLGELTAETSKHDEAGQLLERVLVYYQGRNELSPTEFVWVARACRRLDLFTDVKKSYSRRMVEYSRRMIDQALVANERLPGAHVESGTLALLKYDTPTAKRSFERACQLDPNDPDARVGLARALLAAFYTGQGRYEEAAGNLQKALATDPTHPGAHATLAGMAVTDGDYEAALERLETALKAHPADVGLLATRAAVHLLHGDEKEFERIEQEVLELRPRCARFYEEVALLVQLKFRYAEARDLARKALKVDPDYHPALQILGVNHTRTGDEEEGRRVLGQAFDQDPYNVYTFNTLELFDRLDEQYETIETEHFVIRMHKEELPSQGYVIRLLEEARQKLGDKYGAVPDKVLIELFPDHNDFSARSVGLPGIPALGVCFGNVVTVLSAKEKKAVGTHSWGRTLWHEFAHVATLTRTKNRVPRWFTEGLSVYEESRGRPSWAREYDRDIMTLMSRKLLLPIANLDAGFTKPRYPGQVIMAYYQGGITCEFIDARWGFAKIPELLDAFAQGDDTAAAVRRVFEITPEEFDDLFHQFLENQYSRYAYLPAPSVEQRQELASRVNASPWDLNSRGLLARAYAMHGMPADAERHAGQTLELAESAFSPWLLSGAFNDRELGEAGSPELLAARAATLRAAVGDAHLALAIVRSRSGRVGRALSHLRQALRLGTHDPVTAHHLRGQLHRAQGRIHAAVREFQHAARLTPPNPDIHRLLQACYQTSGDEASAMAELKKICQLDSEEIEGRLAYAVWAKDQNRWDEVRDILDDINLTDPFLPDAHQLLADSLRKTAGEQPARELAERALREYQAALDFGIGYKAGAFFGQAWCQQQLGDAATAIELARQALQDDPDLEAARELLKALGASEQGQ